MNDATCLQPQVLHRSKLPNLHLIPLDNSRSGRETATVPASIDPTCFSVYRGTSLVKKCTPLGPCRRLMPRVLGGSSGSDCNHRYCTAPNFKSVPHTHHVQLATVGRRTSLPASTPPGRNHTDCAPSQHQPPPDSPTQGYCTPACPQSAPAHLRSAQLPYRNVQRF